MEKEHKKEVAYAEFKRWLKQSLIKQREEIIQKKIRDHERREMEEEKKKAKENMKVMAKIAYKEWKERKTEEMRQKKKIEKMEKRRQRMEEEEIRLARRMLVREMQRRKGNGGQVLLAYGLNKNLKKMNDARPARAKSAKPRRTREIEQY